MEKVTIRHAIQADADAIAHFHVRVWRQTYRELAPAEIYAALDENRRRNTWRETLSANNPDQIVLLAELEGMLVAIGAAGAPSAEIFGDLGEIKNLYVDPDLKRQGIGRLLLSKLASHLRERGFPESAWAWSMATCLPWLSTKHLVASGSANIRITVRSGAPKISSSRGPRMWGFDARCISVNRNSSANHRTVNRCPRCVRWQLDNV